MLIHKDTKLRSKWYVRYASLRALLIHKDTKLTVSNRHAHDRLRALLIHKDTKHCEKVNVAK